MITDPNIAYILMLVGIYGLIIEFLSRHRPARGGGRGVPAAGAVRVPGAASELFGPGPDNPRHRPDDRRGLYAPVSASSAWAAWWPCRWLDHAHGHRAARLPDRAADDRRFATASVALLVFALGMVVRARRQELRTGVEHLVGAVATVESVNNGVAWARLEGELWEVACPQALQPQDRVLVQRHRRPHPPGVKTNQCR